MQAFYTSSESKEELASLGKRLVAFSLDVLLLFLLVGIADLLTISSDEQAIFLKPERLLHLLLGLLYFAGTESCSCQATLGKYMLGLHVTTASGERISFKKASIRYFAKPLTLFVLLFRFLKNTPSNPRVTFHDMLSGSRVVLR